MGQQSYLAQVCAYSASLRVYPAPFTLLQGSNIRSLLFLLRIQLQVDEIASVKRNLNGDTTLSIYSKYLEPTQVPKVHQDPL
jgi:hypothetical protein